MSERRAIFVLAVLIVAVSGAALGQTGSRRLSGTLGVGGAPSGQPEDGLGNGAFQLGIALAVDSEILVGARVGRLAFDGDLGPRHEPALSWVNVAGEYLLDEGYYTSGIYFGLGWYRLGEGGSGLGSDDAPGAVLGLTGDFRVKGRFSVFVDLSAHYADLEDLGLLVLGQAGVAYHW